MPPGKATPQRLNILKGIFPATTLAMRPDLYGLASMVNSENKEPKRWGHLKNVGHIPLSTNLCPRGLYTNNSLCSKTIFIKVKITLEKIYKSFSN